jgi:hypothetical protein
LHDGGHIEVCHCIVICLAILLSVFLHVCVLLSHYVGMYVHPGLRDIIVIVLIHMGACIINEVKVVPPPLPGHRHIVGEATRRLHSRLFETRNYCTPPRGTFFYASTALAAIHECHIMRWNFRVMTWLMSVGRCLATLSEEHNRRMCGRCTKMQRGLVWGHTPGPA